MPDSGDKTVRRQKGHDPFYLGFDRARQQGTFFFNPAAPEQLVDPLIAIESAIRSRYPFGTRPWWIYPLDCDFRMVWLTIAKLFYARRKGAFFIRKRRHPDNHRAQFDTEDGR